MSTEPLPPRAVPFSGPVDARVRAPPSKSHAIRLLLTAALSDGPSRVRRIPRGDDTAAVVASLEALGFRIDREGEEDLVVHGADGEIPNSTAELDLRGSGTGLRMLLAFCSLGPGPYLLTGDETLCARPLGGVARALRRLGMKLESADGRAPVTITGGPLRRGPVTELLIDGTRSSHPISSVMLIAPVLDGEVRVRSVGHPVVSQGYVDMTAQVMRQRGASVADVPDGDDRSAFSVRRGGYRAGDATVEGDWSSAAFLLGAAAATGGVVRVEGLSVDSKQPDSQILALLHSYGASILLSEDGSWIGVRGGARRPIRCALWKAPDLAPLMGALACLVDGESEVAETPQLRLKESDRIAAVVAGARALACDAEERPSGFVIRGGSPRGAVIDSHRDHRIAMAFTIAGLAVPGTQIADPGCVSKSYPGFWDDLGRITGESVV